MSRSIGILPGVAAFLAGVAAVALTNRRDRGAPAGDTKAVEGLKAALAQLETRVSAQESMGATRFSQIEAKLDEHSTRLAAMPSTAQIVSAMEELLTKTMSSLDERLTSQARSIDTLKTTVAQTDSLLERVLESLDSLQSFSDPAEFAEDSLLQQRPV